MEFTKCEITELLDRIVAAEKERDAAIEVANIKIERMRQELELRMDNANQSKLETAKGTAQIQNVKEPKVSDWDKVLGFVAKNKAFDILQRRISPAALQARVDAGEDIPGVEIKSGTRFVITKVKEKPCTPTSLI